MKMKTTLMLALLATVAMSGTCLAQKSKEEREKAWLAQKSDEDWDNIIKWEKSHRNEVPHSRKSPAARLLVIKANSLLKGDPTCAAMRKASRLLEKADNLYIKANIFDGDTRTVSRRVEWLKDLAEEGKCRKG
jgi:hypothetical protein